MPTDRALALMTSILDRYSEGEFDLVEAGARMSRVVAIQVGCNG